MAAENLPITCLPVCLQGPKSIYQAEPGGCPGELTFLKKNIQQTTNSALEPPLEAEYKTTDFSRSCETNFKIQDRKMMSQKIIINRIEFK